jgi:hypothetical protein
MYEELKAIARASGATAFGVAPTTSPDLCFINCLLFMPLRVSA